MDGQGCGESLGRCRHSNHDRVGFFFEPCRSDPIDLSELIDRSDWSHVDQSTGSLGPDMGQGLELGEGDRVEVDRARRLAEIGRGVRLA